MNIWYKVKEEDSTCRMAVFRNKLVIGNDGKFSCRYSADECADIFIDGKWVETGPARGDKLWWYSGNIELDLAPGEHMLTVRLLSFGWGESAAAQETIRYGIFFESDAICGKWEYCVLNNCSFSRSDPDWGWYPTITAEENFNYKAIEGTAPAWKECTPFTDDRVLHEPDIPHWECKEEKNYRIIDEQWRKLVVFDDYIRCRCEYTFSGSGEVRLLWNEAPFDSNRKKLHRDSWNNCVLPGKPAVLKFKDGGRWFDYHYRAGRCLQIELSGNIQLTDMKFTSVKYPYSKKWSAHSSSDVVNRVLDMAWNTFDLCSFESFMDCPYYEQMQYVGDGKIESLISFVTEKNTALPLKALKQLGRSTDLYGVTLSRFPSWQEQMIPSFSLVWILILEDYAVWQDCREIIPELEHARQNIEFYSRHLDEDGLPDFTGWDRISGWDGETGWNFLDWHDSLFRGIPIGNCPVATLYVLALEAMARLEKMAGNSGEKYLAMAEQASKKIVDKYFIADKKVFADNTEKNHYSEHPQIFSVLSDNLPNGNIEIKDAMPAGIYFSHYYLEAAYKLKNASAFWERYSQWFTIADTGLRTLPEEFTHPRSDCHAWSSHVLYHYFVSILGIRPRNISRKEWNIDPLIVDIDHASGTMTHSSGNISVSWKREGDSVKVKYSCEDGFTVYHNNKKLAGSGGEFTL